jgi:hypothetical protein
VQRRTDILLGLSIDVRGSSCLADDGRIPSWHTGTCINSVSSVVATQDSTSSRMLPGSTYRVPHVKHSVPFVCA